MKLTIVGGYHDKKVIMVSSLVPIRLYEELPEINVCDGYPDALCSVNFHEYFPQSIKFSYYDDLIVLAPRGQDVAKTIEILINSHGDQA